MPDDLQIRKIFLQTIEFFIEDTVLDCRTSLGDEEGLVAQEERELGADRWSGAVDRAAAIDEILTTTLELDEDQTVLLDDFLLEQGFIPGLQGNAPRSATRRTTRYAMNRETVRKGRNTLLHNDTIVSARPTNPLHP